MAYKGAAQTQQYLLRRVMPRSGFVVVPSEAEIAENKRIQSNRKSLPGSEENLFLFEAQIYGKRLELNRIRNRRRDKEAALLNKIRRSQS